MGGDGVAKAEDARLDGAMDAFKRMMQAEMWLPQGGPPATGIACRPATRERLCVVRRLPACTVSAAAAAVASAAGVTGFFRGFGIHW